VDFLLEAGFEDPELDGMLFFLLPGFLSGTSSTSKSKSSRGNEFDPLIFINR
jgi:hypothetical protein